MKIGVDAGAVGIHDKRLKVGVYHLSVQLLLHLGKIDRSNQYFLYSFHTIDKKLLSTFGDNFQNIVVRPRKGWASIWLPLRARRDKIDVFLGLNQFVPNFLSKNTRKIGFIYDLAFLKYPHMFPDSGGQLTRITESVISKSDDIVTISHNSKKDIMKHYRVEGKNIHVIYPGYKKLKVQKGKKADYFLFIGALKKGKNIPNVILAFDIFQKNHSSDIKLIIVGGDKWRDDGIKKAMNEVSGGTKRKVIFEGHVSDRELEKLYSKALAFVSPSFYEGFGLTHVEAMASGIPVIASDKGSLPEVVGDAGILVDPNSPQQIAKAMLSISKNKKLRDQLSKKGVEKSKNYSWIKFAKGLHERIQRYEKA